MNANVPEPKVKRWRPQGFEGVEVTSVENFVGWHLPAHVQRSYDFVVNRRFGEVRARYGRQSYRHSSGRDLVWLQHAGELLHPVTLDDTPYSGCWVSLYPERMSSVLSDLDAPEKIYFPDMLPGEALNSRLSDFIAETVRALEEPATHIEREIRLLRLVYAALEHGSDSPPPDLRLGKEHKAVSLVKEVLHAHPERDLKLDDLEAVTNLNKFYLMRVFRQDVGLSPHKYQTGLRVDLAKERLAKGAEILEVALDLGFSDQAHFTRTFKRYTQTTPGRFQRDSLQG